MGLGASRGAATYNLRLCIRNVAVPIYAYRCESCGYAQDVLQKISDPLLTMCPACGAATFSKQITAAGFQLKGTGWYATDFKGSGAKPAAGGTASTTPAPAESSTSATSSDAAPATGSGGDAGTKP
jgi:putative FmdB family regulatory protein